MGDVVAVVWALSLLGACTRADSPSRPAPPLVQLAPAAPARDPVPGATTSFAGHPAVVAFARAVHPVLDKVHRRRLESAALLRAGGRDLTCRLADASESVWIPLHNAGVWNGNARIAEDVFEALDGLHGDSLAIVTDWCERAAAYEQVASTADCRTGSPDPALDIACDDEPISGPMPSRAQRVEALRDALRACEDARQVQQACVHGADADAAIGERAGSVLTRALRSFRAGGYGLAQMGIDSDPELLQDLIVAAVTATPEH